MFWIKKMNVVFGLALWVASVCFTSTAQPKYLQLNKFATEEGLSSSTIISLLQDHNGFMWIGTAEGLNRYDGSEFKVYKNDRSNPLSLPDNLVISMLLNGKIMYIGTNAGLSMYNPRSDEFITFNQDSSSCLYNLIFQVRDIEKGPGESLYIAGNNDLILFNPVKNTYKSFLLKLENGQDLVNAKIDDVCFDSNKNLWLGTNKGLYLFQPKTQNFKLVNKGINNEDYSKTRFHKIIEDNTGKLWLASYAHGLFCINKSNEGENRLVNYGHDPNNPKSILKNRLLSLAVDADNNLWIGAENDGVFLLNREEHNFWHFLTNDSDPLSATTYSGECLYFDNSENLWIGTYANGINIAPKNSDAIVSYSRFKGGDLSITNNMVNAFSEDKYGNIWIGTDGGGINAFDKKTGLFKNLNTKNSKLPSDYILSMAADEDKIWLSTWGEGLLCYNQKKGTFESFSTFNSSIIDNNIFNIWKAPGNDLWLGSYHSGLLHYFPETDKSIVYNTSNSQINSNFVNVIRAGNDGNLFVGTQAGFLSFNLETEQFKEYSLLDLDSKTLSNQHVYDILVENDTSVWVATLSGLNQINPKTGVNVKYTTKDGLPSNNIRGILKDDFGDLWFATSDGVCRFNKDGKKYTIFTKEDGLKGSEFRPRSLINDSEGRLYFGGVNGFIIIHPDKIAKNERIPVIQFTGFEIFNEQVLPGATGSPLQQIISETKELKLRHDQSVLTFHFSVLDYTRPGKNQHAYMLENFDKDWIFCGSKREVTYTNLDPGKYLLKIKGSNNNGVWNEEGVAIEITIIPPWWATWWFKLLIVLFIIVAVLSLYFIRISSLEKQKEKLEVTVRERTQELAKINATKDKLFSIIAHDLRSPFNTILGFTNVLIDNYADFDKETTRRVLKDLKTSGENAFSLLENLLSWSQSQQNNIEFKPEIISVDSYVTKIIDEFGVISSKKKIELIDKITIMKFSVYADFNMLSLVFRNLIINALKFSHPKSEVWIEAKESVTGWVTFCITDHGIGMEQDKVNAIFKLGEQHSSIGTQGEKGTGLGLILSKEFIEKHKGRIWLESEFGKGSVFYFSVPKSEQVYSEA